MKDLVDIHQERCIGCTRCMRACPMEAIRIIDDKAHLLKERCIFCGNCITNCHKNAYRVYSDSFANLSKYKVNIAILPISIYGMTLNLDELGGIYETLMNYGFDEIGDLSVVHSMLSERVIEYIQDSDNTYILSQCPSVLRLIQIKYPHLIPHVLPFAYPFEIAGKLYRKVFSEKYSVKETEVGISYISECLSNFVAIKENISNGCSSINHVFLYNDILRTSSGKKHSDIQVVKKGVQFAKVGAYKHLTNNNEILTVDGIKNVDTVLERIYLNQLKNVLLVEAYSCTGGCVGGNFMIENPFVAKWRVNQFYESVPENKSTETLSKYQGILSDNDWLFTTNIEPATPITLSNNINEAILKMKKINEILSKLPNIDCCACGSPSCRALAEDIVNNVKSIDDCRLRKENGNVS